MILDQNLSEVDVISTVEDAKAMTVSADASRLFFKMFIKNTYSNPIGSLVRELSSNMLDSHTEANVKIPVIIRKGEDENTHMPYISFIDFGVGMSPERMSEVYCVLMTSTKRLTNTQIGCFGLGSKSVLAYNRQLSYGSTESDNSFFVITIFDNIKYTYLVYEGKESPMLSLLSQEETSEHNGTEVRVPILSSDLYKFENELIRQLYYFDSIIFENFDNDKISNDYQILRAKTFLYRGNDFSSYIHICLGKVAYPINFDVLGLDSSDYQFPVALNFEIGDINVVTSREAIDYSNSTILLIKKRLKEAKEELINLLSKQHDNVVTLEDYYKFRENYKKLELIEGKTIVFNKLEVKDITLNNFKYNHIKTIPKSGILFDIQYRCVEYTNNKSRRRSETVFNGDYFKMQYSRDAYIWDGYEFAQKRNAKLNYLKYLHNTFHLITKKKITIEDIKINFDCTTSELGTVDANGIYIYSPIYDDILDIINENNIIVESRLKKYDDLEIPQSYLDTIKKKRNFIKGSLVINIVTSNANVNRETIELKELGKFKGTIVYGDPDDINKLKYATRAFSILFAPHTEVVRNKNYNGFYSSSFAANQHNKVLFIQVAKGNIKKLVNIEDTIHVSQIYYKFFHRKEDNVLLGRYLSEIKDKFTNLNDFYLNNDLQLIYPKLAEYVCNINSILEKNKNILY